MKKQTQKLTNTQLYELGADRRLYSTMVSMLADRINSFASRLAAEGRDGESMSAMTEEACALQEVIQLSLKKLNNATVQEYMAKERAGLD